MKYQNGLKAPPREMRLDRFFWPVANIGEWQLTTAGSSDRVNVQLD